MWGVGMGRRRRYRCGCVVRATHSRGGAVRYAPLCWSHGDGFALRTLLIRGVIGMARDAVNTLSERR